MKFNELYTKEKTLYLATAFVLLALTQTSFAFIPEDNPVSAVGIDFTVPLEQEPVYLAAFYNSTRIEFDYNADGAMDDFVTLNKSQTLNRTNLPASCHIHASKPIIATQKEEWNSGCMCPSEYGIWGYSWGFSLPKTSELSTEYYVAHPYTEVYITAAYSNTTLQIDQGDDGSWEVNQVLPPGTVYSNRNLSPGDKIVASRSIAVVQKEEWNSGCMCSNDHGIWGYGWGFLLSPPGEDYFVSLEEETVYLIALEDATLIEFDYNGDGAMDDFVTLNKSQTLNRTNLPASCHIHASKPILATQRNEEYNFGCASCNEKSNMGYSFGFILPKTSELGKEYYVANPFNTIYITATTSNTTIQIDEGNDGTWDFTQMLAPGVLYNNSNLSEGDRIRASKPIIVTQQAPEWDSGCMCSNSYGRWYYSAGFLLNSPSLETTQEMPGTVNPGGIFTLTAKVMNPTETPATNLKVNLTYNSTFTSVSNVTVRKYNLTTDALLSGPTLAIFTPTCNQGTCVGTVTQATLNPDEYLTLEYQLQAPVNPAVYEFKQVETSYQAETWLWGF